MQKILSTIVAAVYALTEIRPEAWIFASGSTDSRTRLYRMGISKNLNQAEKDFEIYGRINDSWEPFAKNMDYEAFLIKRKITTFEI